MVRHMTRPSWWGGWGPYLAFLTAGLLAASIAAISTLDLGPPRRVLAAEIVEPGEPGESAVVRWTYERSRQCGGTLAGRLAASGRVLDLPSYRLRSQVPMDDVRCTVAGGVLVCADEMPVAIPDDWPVGTSTLTLWVDWSLTCVGTHQRQQFPSVEIPVTRGF